MSGKHHINIGDIAYYCYDLFGEHLIKEVIVEEITLDRKGLKGVRAISLDGRSTYYFGVYSHPLDEIVFTREDANRWLGEK